MKSAKGFTLVELVTVVVLLGIVSTVVAVKFSSRSGFSEYAVRDEIRTAIRFAQQRAMYDQDPTSGNCYSFYWDGNGFGPEKNDGYFAHYLGASGNVALSGDYANVALSPSSGEVFFDALGNARQGGCGGALISTTDIAVSDADTLTLRIHPTGYVQAL